MRSPLVVLRLSTAIVAVTFVAASSERAAQASPVFPGVVQSTLSLPKPPACTLCHSTPSGGMGTATTAFATYLRSRGLTAGDEESLRSALKAMVGEKHDSDGDGVTDDAELAAGDDPNGQIDTSIEAPRYGCGAQLARRGAQASDSVLGLAFAGALALWRRRSRSGARRPR